MSRVTARYRAVVLPSAILTILTLAFAWYSIGVVDRHSCRELAQKRFTRMEQLIDEGEKEQSAILQELQSDYQTRARIIAIMIDENPALLETETMLEEWRLAIGADIVSVSDATGQIVYSTEQSADSDMVNEKFMTGTTDRLFSDWALLDNTSILVGTARLDASGVVQVTFTPNDLASLLGTNDFAGIVKNASIMEHGTLSILDSTTNVYLSHTDSSRVGTVSAFAADSFSETSGYFDAVSNGSEVYIIYENYSNYILICTIPFSEVYDERDNVLSWLLFLGVLLTATAALCVHATPERGKPSEEKTVK